MGPPRNTAKSYLGYYGIKLMLDYVRACPKSPAGKASSHNTGRSNWPNHQAEEGQLLTHDEQEEYIWHQVIPV